MKILKDRTMDDLLTPIPPKWRKPLKWILIIALIVGVILIGRACYS